METDEPGIGRSGVPGQSETAAADEEQALATSAAAWADEKLASILESLLFVAGEPVSLSQLANALEEVPRERIRQALLGMATQYARSRRGILLEEIAGGYQLRTPSEHAIYVRRLLSAKPPRLSRPLLETLTIVAYRQPITRPEIEQLRGVDSGGVLETLAERNLIRIAGRKDAPGRPLVYTTTPDFLELFGLKDLESLPDLEEFRELEGLRESAGLVQTPLQVSATPITIREPRSAARTAPERIPDNPASEGTGPDINAAGVSNAGQAEAGTSTEAVDRRENQGDAKDSARR